MIENLRKYTGLMIATFVILFISVLDGKSVRNSGSGTSIFKIGGRTSSDTEFNTFGSTPLELANLRVRSGNHALHLLIKDPSSVTTGRDDVPVKFLVRRMIPRQAKDCHGVYPSVGGSAGFDDLDQPPLFPALRSGHAAA